MASQIIHALEGFAALTNAAPDFASTVQKTTLPWFYLGCQGPDIFYHSQRTAPYGIYYGGLLHRSKFGAAAAALLDNVLASEPSAPEPHLCADNPVHAFTLGFLTHGWIDSLTHPYVIYHAGWYDPAKPETRILQHAHTFLERILDSLYWTEQQGMPVSSFQQEQLLIPDNAYAQVSPPGVRNEWSPLLSSIANNLSLALSEVYGSRFSRFADSETRMRNAFFDTFHVFRETDPSAITKAALSERLRHLPDGAKAMLFPEQPDTQVDWQNKEHRTWKHPCLPERDFRDSWDDLLGAARERNTRLLAAALGVGAALPEQDTGISLPAQVFKQGTDFETRHQNPLSSILKLLPTGTLNVGNEEGRQEQAIFSQALPVHDEILRFSST